MLLLPFTVPLLPLEVPVGLVVAEGLLVAGVVALAVPTPLVLTPAVPPSRGITVFCPPGFLVFMVPLCGVDVFPPTRCLELLAALLYLSEPW